MMWLILLINFLILLGVAIALYKIRRIHLATFELIKRTNEIERESKSLYPQLQTYADLVRLLKLDSALPTLRGWAASPDFLLEIARHALEAKPATCVECSSGASTVVLARCMQMNGAGHVYSLEHNPNYAEKTRQELARQGLSDWATVIDAPLVEVTDIPGQRWYSLDKLPPLRKAVDILVIDGPPQDTCPLARYPALPQLISKFSDICVVFLDDADREDEKEAVRRWTQAFPQFRTENLWCEKGAVKLIR